MFLNVSSLVWICSEKPLRPCLLPWKMPPKASKGKLPASKPQVMKTMKVMKMMKVQKEDKKKTKKGQAVPGRHEFNTWNMWGRLGCIVCNLFILSLHTRLSIKLTLGDIDFENGTIHIDRLKRQASTDKPMFKENGGVTFNS